MSVDCVTREGSNDRLKNEQSVGWKRRRENSATKLKEGSMAIAWPVACGGEAGNDSAAARGDAGGERNTCNTRETNDGHGRVLARARGAAVPAFV
jgi:hypothetical protein